MAGHSRTVGTNRHAPGTSGRSRRVRRHLPPGEAAAAKRHRAHQSARSVALHHIQRTSDPLTQIDRARDYVRSAAGKYRTDQAELTSVVEALLAAGDRIYQTGEPKPARRPKNGGGD